jgi:F0F1-type ATP synthase assembly protein I
MPPSGNPPTLDAAPGPTPEAPGLFDQVGETRESMKRLVGAHVELAKAEFEDIADAVKRAAILVGVAIGAGLFAGLLVGVGLPLFLGEWIFGSIGWGILLGLLLLAAVGVAAVTLAFGPALDGRVGRSFVVAAVIGIVVGVVFGLDLTNRGWTVLADNVAGNLAADSRPLVVAVITLAVIGAVLGLIGGLAGGMGPGSLGTAIAGAVGGVALGFLTAAAPGPRVGAAIGVAVGLIAWIGLMVASLMAGGFDSDKLKDRFWPSRTIDVTKETIEWARERMPLTRRS